GYPLDARKERLDHRAPRELAMAPTRWGGRDHIFATMPCGISQVWRVELRSHPSRGPPCCDLWATLQTASQGETMNLGNKLRRIRQVRGLSVVALAKHARVTPGFISQLEYSQTVPSLQTLQRVAAALDVSLMYFLLEESRQPQVMRQ